MTHKCIACSVLPSGDPKWENSTPSESSFRLPPGITFQTPWRLSERSIRLICMATQIDADKIEHQLQQRLNSRMDSVRALVKSRQAVLEAQEALGVAENEDARHYQAALSAGWTADELRGSGLPEPEKKQRVRKRAVRKPAASPQTSPSNESEGHH